MSKNKENLWTRKECFQEVSEVLDRLDEREKAELRVQLRKRFILPEQPEPLLEKNDEQAAGPSWMKAASVSSFENLARSFARRNGGQYAPGQSALEDVRQWLQHQD